jgi:hypothetical protein
VVIELTGCRIRLSEPLWRPTPEEEAEQARLSMEAMSVFMSRMAGALEEQGGEMSGSMQAPEAGPGAVDTAAASSKCAQVERVAALKRRLSDLAGGSMMVGGAVNLPLDVEEKFLEHVLAFETAPPTTLWDTLAREGLVPRPPNELSDQELETELTRLIEKLAECGFYLEDTNHLSDRELYALLLDKVLVEERPDLPLETGWRCHITISDFGPPDDPAGTQTYLKYYADPATRDLWKKDFPDDPLPPHEEPEWDRDRHLPRPPEE